MTITEFLEARIAEDEAAALEPRGRHWSTNSCYEIEDENGQCVLEVGHDGQYDFEGNVIEHFARHDPARVLAECKAKRAILANSADAQSGYMDDPHWNGFNDCHESAIYALAAVYAGHKDYDPDWA